jgi:hypothetical protein
MVHEFFGQGKMVALQQTPGRKNFSFFSFRTVPVELESNVGNHSLKKQIATVGVWQFEAGQQPKKVFEKCQQKCQQNSSVGSKMELKKVGRSLLDLNHKRLYYQGKGDDLDS